MDRKTYPSLYHEAGMNERGNLMPSAPPALLALVHLHSLGKDGK
jgi:hypothetical protein